MFFIYSTNLGGSKIRAMIQNEFQKYPRQFWLLFFGMLLSMTGSSMVWPFLTLYLVQELDLTLTAAASMLSVAAVTTLLASFVAGPAADRLGRKPAMYVGLLGTGLTYTGFLWANTAPMFALIMGLHGCFRPVFRVGAHAMVADLVPSEERADAYALLRMASNAGVALGPTIGGFLAMVSFKITFMGAALALVAYGITVLLFVGETLPALKSGQDVSVPAGGNGYSGVFKNKQFILMCTSLILTTTGAVQMFALLPVYGKENFGLLESQFGFIVATNAIMVVLLQYLVTKRTKHLPSLPLMAAGASLYVVGLGSVALGNGFWNFLISMVVMTIGELMLVPTATTLAANLAPPDSRGKYMSILGLTWGLGSGIGPLIGGILNDTYAPVAIWYGAATLAAVGTSGFVLLAWRYRSPQKVERVLGI
jgi:MFS family permease